jgi:hypothetical protein
MYVLGLSIFRKKIRENLRKSVAKTFLPMYDPRNVRQPHQ